MTDAIMRESVVDRRSSSNRNDGRKHGEWYYAALCVDCRVCGAKIGELCHDRNGEIFGEFSKHHYWRYRDVRHYLGIEIDWQVQTYVPPDVWKARREREKLNSGGNAA